jgi:integrase
MATIHERKTRDGKTRYQVKVRLRGHPAEMATFARKKDAQKWAQETEVAIREGRYFKVAESRRRTVADLVDRYLREVLPGKPGSQNQRIQYRWWREQLGPLSLAEVTPAVVADCRGKLAHGLTPSKKPASPATQVRYLAALSHAFTIAVREWGWLEENPVKKVRRPQEPRGRVRFLSDEERVGLLEACRKSKNRLLYPVVVLALSTGARQGEILWLRWRNIDLQRGTALLEETKNGERRTLPLTGHVLDVLRNFARVRRMDSDLVFPNRNGKKPASLRGPWEEALRQAGITNFRFHDLRHSCASYLAMNGATPVEIAAVLGHKTLIMVKRYSHLSEQHVSAVVSRMSRKIFQ